MQIFVRGGVGDAPSTAALLLSSHDTVGSLMQLAVREELKGSIYVSYGGKILGPPSARLVEFGIGDCSTVELGLRVRGGGGDGGATGAESRDCYLQMYLDKKPDKVDPLEASLARWTCCALTAEALKPPCVIDPIGNVFNKEAIVNALLTKSLPKRLGYIKGLKDLVTVHLASIPGVESDDEHANTKFQCPITGQEYNGRFKFVALKKCGHVVSTRALKEVRTTACLVCRTEYKEEDKITVNGNDEEMEILRKRLEESKRTSKKEKKSTITLTTTAAVKVKIEAENDVNEGENKKRNLSENVNDSLVDAAVAVAVKKAKMKVPANATKQVYESIFTSSNAGKNIKETYSCRALPIGRN